MIWLKVSALGHYNEDEQVLAKTADGRMMMFKVAILKSMLHQGTPNHLQFPATHFICRHVLAGLQEQS